LVIGVLKFLKLRHAANAPSDCVIAFNEADQAVCRTSVFTPPKHFSAAN